MTFEQRMAELGVDLSDLRTDYSDEEYGQVFDTYLNWGEELKGASYILHLVDIIDRMETRIVNLTGERDYLISMYGFDCKECKRYDECIGCDGDIVENWGGVPEDWRPDE